MDMYFRMHNGYVSYLGLRVSSAACFVYNCGFLTWHKKSHYPSGIDRLSKEGMEKEAAFLLFNNVKKPCIKRSQYCVIFSSFRNVKFITLKRYFSIEYTYFL